MSKSIDLPLRIGIALSDQCSHGRTWDEDCLRCEIVTLEESLKWMEPQVKRDRARLNRLREATNPGVVPGLALDATGKPFDTSNDRHD